MHSENVSVKSYFMILLCFHFMRDKLQQIYRSDYYILIVAINAAQTDFE